MNKWLITGFDAIITLLALALIAGGALVGFFYGAGSQPYQGQNYAAGAVVACVGAIGGVIAAYVTCGLFATLSEIEKHLRKIAEMPLVRIPDAKHADD